MHLIKRVLSNVLWSVDYMRADFNHIAWTQDQ